MHKKLLTSLIAAGMLLSMAAPSFAYPERPESARVYYELWYFVFDNEVIHGIPVACPVGGLNGAYDRASVRLNRCEILLFAVIQQCAFDAVLLGLQCVILPLELSGHFRSLVAYLDERLG